MHGNLGKFNLQIQVFLHVIVAERVVIYLISADSSRRCSNAASATQLDIVLQLAWVIDSEVVVTACYLREVIHDSNADLLSLNADLFKVNVVLHIPSVCNVVSGIIHHEVLPRLNALTTSRKI